MNRNSILSALTKLKIRNSTNCRIRSLPDHSGSLQSLPTVEIYVYILEVLIVFPEHEEPLLGSFPDEPLISLAYLSGPLFV